MQERIQKIISRAGIASRRHAEALMLAGAVTVNGKVVTELGSKADPAADHIRVGSKLIHVPETQSYYVLHKPHNVVATMSDPEGRPSLRGYVHGISGRIFPVGRLEFHASGLLLLMSDGELANKLLRGSDRIPQTYRLKVNTRLSEEAAKKVGIAAGAQIRLVKDAPNAWYEIELMDASRDRLRRALAEQSVQVEKFMRVRFGGIDLGELPPGAYRSLSPEEVARLGRAAEGLLHVARVPTHAALPKRPAAARPKFPYRGRPGRRPGTPTGPKPPWKRAHSSSNQQSGRAGSPQGRPSFRPAAPTGSKPPWKRALFSPAGPPRDQQSFKRPSEKGGAAFRPGVPTGPKPPWKRKKFTRDQQSAARGPAKPARPKRRGQKPFRRDEKE